MRVKVLRDAKGRILATVDQTPNPFVRVEPIIEKAEEVEEVEAPDNYEYNLRAFYRKLEKPSLRKRK